MIIIHFWSLCLWWLYLTTLYLPWQSQNSPIAAPMKCNGATIFSHPLAPHEEFVHVKPPSPHISRKHTYQWQYVCICNFVNFKIYEPTFFKSAYRGRVCKRVFIVVSLHACCTVSEKQHHHCCNMKRYFRNSNNNKK